MLLRRLHCRWRYRQLKKSLRRSSVFETVEIASDLLSCASNARVLMFNTYINDWVTHHFLLLHRQYRNRRRVLDNLWVLFREWKAAVTDQEKGEAVLNLIIYTQGLQYAHRTELLHDFVAYLRNVK